MSDAEQEVIRSLSAQLHAALDKLAEVREMTTDWSAYADDEGDFRARLVAVLDGTP